MDIRIGSPASHQILLRTLAVPAGRRSSTVKLTSPLFPASIGTFSSLAKASNSFTELQATSGIAYHSLVTGQDSAIRRDSLKSFSPRQDLYTLINHSPLPARFANRPTWEGGQYDGDETSGLDALRLTIELGADYIDVELQSIGAVNCIIRRESDGKLLGYNTDYVGAISAIEDGLRVSQNGSSTAGSPLAGELFVVIGAGGAGGAGKALAYGAKEKGATVVIANCTFERAKELADIVGGHAISLADLDNFHPEDGMILANTTPIGVHPKVDETPVSKVPIIAIVTGERDLISRILCAKFVGFLTFGTLDSGIVSAPGQPMVKDLLDLYNLRQIGRDTNVFGIIGKSVSHSKLPHLYNVASELFDYDGRFLPRQVDELSKFLKTSKSKDYAGFSWIGSLKEAAVKCCDEVDPVAKSIGAVNCIIRRASDGKLVGYNTNYKCGISAIEDGLQVSQNISSTAGSPLAGKLFVVIGAGGAGKALAYGAKEKGARVVIANRTLERAKELADNVGGHAISLADLDNFHPEDGMILANTTPIGMHPEVDETPISKHALKNYSLVFDVVYTPEKTRLLREAEEFGVKTVSGVEMFIREASEQFKRLTGLNVSKELFREIMYWGEGERERVRNVFQIICNCYGKGRD